jgi:hypothetical protein
MALDVCVLDDVVPQSILGFDACYDCYGGLDDSDGQTGEIPSAV